MLRAVGVFILLSSVQLQFVLSQEDSDIDCPQYFTFEELNNVTYGKLILPATSIPKKLEVHLSKRGVEPAKLSRYNITFIDSEEENIKRLMKGKSIRYSIRFPSEFPLPRMVLITVNDEDICSASEYPPPNKRIKIRMTYTAVLNRPGVIGKPEFEIKARSNSVHVSASYNAYNCGRPVVSGTPFVGNNPFFTRGQFPWLTAILQVDSPDSGLTFICGGSLLSSRTVISAAHCFRTVPAEKLVIHLGRHNLQNSRESGVEQYEIETLLIHPEYNTWAPDADLALLTTRTPAEFSKYIQPICLWNESNNEDRIVGLMGTVAGWGVEDGTNMSQWAKMATARIISRKDCVHRSDEFQALTSPRTLCAGNRDGTGPCMGDSGSGLMIQLYGRWLLRAIVSAGQTVGGKCDLGDYVIYTDVAKHKKWVARNTLYTTM